VMDSGRLRRALDHAAWRDPSVQVRRHEEIRRGLAVMERTAACVDMAIERLDEVAGAIVQGSASTSPLMRGLLATRIDEVLDSLERISVLAGEGNVNLLDGGTRALRVRLETGELSYVLHPMSLTRGARGLAIPSCDSAFDDEAETAAIADGVGRARQRLQQFANRLSHDAATLLRLLADGPAGLAGHADSAQSSLAAEAAPNVAEEAPGTVAPKGLPPASSWDDDTALDPGGWQESDVDGPGERPSADHESGTLLLERQSA
jgi:hypothetical protein